MLKVKTHLLPLASSATFCIVLAVGCENPTSSAQNSANTSLAKTPERKRNAVVKTAAVTPANPTAENARLKDALEWNFGAKPQRGWSLYAELIRQTVGAETNEEAPEFARAVAVWQGKNNLDATGTIDRETLYKLIEFWQSQRLNSSAYPADEDLLDAPITDFYDPTRAVELLKVEREAYRAYKKMVAAAAADLKLKTNKNGELAADEKYLRIISAFRSREYQAKLRAASPQSGSAGLAMNSPHFTGRALDIYVGGEPTMTKDFNRAVQVKTPVYRWLVKNAARFGFYPYFYEPWHWEYVPRNARFGEK